MTTKKKLIISISSMGLAVVAALGVTFGVLAAQQQAVRNQFSVTYEARNVNATAKASYKLKNGADDSSINLLDNAADSVSFTATEATTTKSLSGSTAAQLTATIDYVVYMFEFKNNTTAGGRSMTVALTDNATATNVNVYYATTTSSTVIDADDFDVLFTQSETKKLGSSSEDADALTLATTVPATATTVAPQQYGYFFIVVEIIDNTIDASYVSTTSDNSGIAWALESINNA